MKRPVCLATLKSCNTKKQSVCGYIYIYIYIYISVCVCVYTHAHIHILKKRKRAGRFVEQNQQRSKARLIEHQMTTETTNSAADVYTCTRVHARVCVCVCVWVRKGKGQINQFDTTCQSRGSKSITERSNHVAIYVHEVERRKKYYDNIFFSCTKFLFTLIWNAKLLVKLVKYTNVSL